MSDHRDPVVLDLFPNPYIAEAMVTILRDEGVTAYVEGSNLQDEFAASQRAMGNLTTRVFVPEEQLDEARAVLAAARAAGRLNDGDDPQADEEGES